MTDLLLATNNAGKVAELQTLLPEDVVIRTLSEVGIESPAETGSTIAENAALKAIHAARASGLLTLADDSGLEVNALGGRPGVRSARYAGDKATDDQNIDKLLNELSTASGNDRDAAFVCVLTLANADGVLASASGRCTGTIGSERRGSNGFGYDPVFLLEDGRTMAELDAVEKNQKSHRGIALREIMPALLIAIAAQRLYVQGVGQ
jgi:XTP/dITP diphosphohydrolase